MEHGAALRRIDSMTDGSSDDERRLLLLHRDGDPGAFVRLVAKYRRPVFSYLVRCGVPVADRDDLFRIEYRAGGPA